MICPTCDGYGEIEVVCDVRASEATGGLSELHGVEPCGECGGAGAVPDAEWGMCECGARIAPEDRRFRAVPATHSEPGYEEEMPCTKCFPPLAAERDWDSERKRLIEDGEPPF